MWTLNAPQHLQWSYENWRLLTPNKQTLRTKWSILFWCLLYFLTKTTLILPPLRSDSSPIALQGPYNAAIVSFLRCRWWGTLRSKSAAHCVRKVYGSSISCQKLHTSPKDKRPWLRGTSYWWNEKNSRHLFLRKSNKILWNKTTRLHVI